MFDIVAAGFIFLNAIVMALESQFQGLSIGADLKYKDLNTGHTETWANAQPVFNIFGYFFGAIFTIELLLKIIGQRLDFFRHVWNYIDTIIIVTWIISVASGTSTLPVEPTLLRVARLARLLRLLRVLHTFRSLDALYIITTALSGSFSTLAWACVLFFVVQMALALLVSNVVSSYYLADESVELTERQAVYVYFGTFTRSIYSMFEITLANWPPVSRLLAENVSEWFMLFGVLHKLAIGFAVVSVVNGVFMQETFSVASSDDRVMIQKRNRMLHTHKMKMQRFFDLADKSKNGSIDLEEFQTMTAHKEVSAWLSSMELDVSDADKLFYLIDRDKRDGQLTLEELVYGVGRLKGAARSLDVAFMLEELHDLKALLLQKGADHL
ncbi:Sodium channel protein type 11 subunit alpha (NaN) (Sensory neuron sodium channel 2) (Sodium channel protein type XI subunit alpha) (Voltage-gated sodium channel subunit alpha Nav1.9) [Durusdinium trenchii]|uniref:Sodium channel protein type 11 subunit alpha (NaN) (Sensory neuron sodium channel 2) (Sodium channel protein type XI subunit alpha) (Voltage-gated sodium channel subunit alpha Nav1.9) n=1 Tax=Durusdinium trenchii TaxID=1381693 RepID=A0ABP0R4T2_9DINO